MSPSPLSPTVDAALTADELRILRGSWLIFLVVGIAMVALGVGAISYACLVSITIAATWVFGFLLLTGGIGEIIQSFSASHWGGSILHLLLGVLYGVVGFVIVDQPAESAIAFTRLFAIFLMISGAFRVLAALMQRFPGWMAFAVSGAISFLLGLMVYKQWPASGLWFIGLYLGIEMISSGVARIALALTLKAMPDPAE